MPNPGKTLVLWGGVIALLGGLLHLLPKIPVLGRLPGDFMIKRENFTFYFPLATSLLISVLLSLLLRFLGKK